MTTLRHRVYEILEPANPGDRTSRAFDLLIMSLIIANVLAVIVGTVSSIRLEYSEFLYQLEVVSVVVFTIEYVLRVWACTENPKYRGPVLGRLKYAVSPMALVDLLAILPFYLPFVVRLDLRFLRILRLTRMTRLFKVGRYSESMQVLMAVVRDKKEEIFICLYIGGILLIVAASTMYFIENPAQPEVFPDIPSALWWGVATLTTVGYGDVYPVTPLGRILGAAVSILGIGMFALPAGILASGFSEELQNRRTRNSHVCPHCGKQIAHR